MIVSENKQDTAALEEGFLESLVKKPRLWQQYIDDIFMI